MVIKASPAGPKVIPNRLTGALKTAYIFPRSKKKLTSVKPIDPSAKSQLIILRVHPAAFASFPVSCSALSTLNVISPFSSSTKNSHWYRLTTSSSPGVQARLGLSSTSGLWSVDEISLGGTVRETCPLVDLFASSLLASASFFSQRASSFSKLSHVFSDCCRLNELVSKSSSISPASFSAAARSSSALAFFSSSSLVFLSYTSLPV